MSTALFSADEKLGLLLYLLGPAAVEQSLRAMEPARGTTIRNFVRELGNDPPSADEIQFVLDDFESCFRVALASLPPPEKRKKDAKGSGGADEDELSGPTIVSFPTVDCGDDPAMALARLDPWQVAVALGNDQPLTIGLVLSQLPPVAASRILEKLPEAQRQPAFLHLSRPQPVATPIVQRLLRTTFDKANAIRERRDDLDQTERVVELMRSMPKELRKSMMTGLMEADQALGAAVRQKMYRFDDINRLEDRGIQTVLARVPSDQLIMALTRAPDGLGTRIFANMSKRARQTVEEEIGFNDKATDAELEHARNEIAQLLARMDEAGEISL